MATCAGRAPGGHPASTARERYCPFVQLRAPGFEGVPVSVIGSKVLNLDAGFVRSITGPLPVKVRIPVAWIARSVD